MTAPDYVARVAELLGEHSPRTCDDAMRSCGCGWMPDNGWWPSLEEFAAHQAEVLAAAGLIPTTVEWGVREFGRRKDRMIIREGFTKEQAIQYAEDEWSAEGVVSRAVTDWKDATDD